MQQVATASGVLVMLGVITALGRSLTLTEFGLYGLTVSIAGNLLILQLSVEGAAVRAMAGVPPGLARDRVFSNAVALYACVGVVAGVGVVVAGGGLVGVLGVDSHLRDEARLGFVALGVATALGWPFKASQDALRGCQRFGAAAVGEIGAYLVLGALMVTLLATGAPLWALIAVGGSMSVIIGITCTVPLVLANDSPCLRRDQVSRQGMRELVGVAAGLLAAGLADLVLYSLDRVILAAFRSAATVGLYESAARAHNLLRQLQGTLVLTVAPVASGYIAADDRERLLDLLLRGTRYIMAVVVPVTVVLMVLSGPILEVWLGPRFRQADLAMSILCSYWLVSSMTGVAASVLVAAGRVRALAGYAWLVAIANLALSLVLTPLFGLNGMMLGTTIPYVVLVPYFLRLLLSTFPDVTLASLARECVVPSYSCAAVLAVALMVLRLSVDLDTVPEVAMASGFGLLTYWAGYFVVWLRPNERLLVRSFLQRPNMVAPPH